MMVYQGLRSADGILRREGLRRKGIVGVLVGKLGGFEGK